MYQAELHGKLSPRVERMEDILTSNVFSFFKYSNRAIFLKGYLNKLGLNISVEEAKGAEFLFWPHFEDNTEPDLVIIIGNYYLLIEAKYFSEFGGEINNTKAQLLREIDGGKLEAKSYAKTFTLIAITADTYFKKDKFQDIPAYFWPQFIWTNWQSVAAFLNSILEIDRDIRKEERDFASDLCKLLDKKNLRGFQSFEIPYYLRPHMRLYDSLFFDAKTAQFRGAFIGFSEALLFDKRILPPAKTIFLRSEKRHFTHLLKVRKLQPVEKSIFYRGDRDHGR
ncbi:MAG: hypothetical protein U9N83_17050 [Thermodesulfobacteriota bacterium]|jgi:hypothetical protein|nr:hypothetical protein [Thermodesulfobacteriota bacterium]